MAFEVTLQPSGHVFTSTPDTPVLTAGLQAGFQLPYSCRSGICGTCKGRVLSGTVDHGNASESYLTLEERQAGITMLCQARARSDLVVEVRELQGLAGIQTRVVPCRVIAIERAAEDVTVLRVRIPMNEHMRFLAGQYVDLLLANGERRSYSIACPPHPQGVTELEFHIRHIPGGLFTDHVFGGMKPRELLKFEGPLGTCFVREESRKPIVFLASGTGFAPIKAMLLDAFARSMNASRELRLYWGGRTRPDLYMMDTVRQWAETHGHFTFVPVLSAPTPACGWSGRTGNVHEAVLQDFGDLSGHQVYACGAPVMVDAARQSFVRERGLPDSEFFADEFFNASDRIAAGHATTSA